MASRIADGEPPAQRGQQHRRDVADRQLAGNGVAAPEQGGQQQQQIGVSVHAVRSVRARERLADLGRMAGQVNDAQRGKSLCLRALGSGKEWSRSAVP